MRVCALILGAVLLPGSVLAQVVSPINPPAGQAVPMRARSTMVCSSLASRACNYQQAYAYQSYAYGSQYNLGYGSRFRPGPYAVPQYEQPRRWVYGQGSYRFAYGDPHVPVCPVSTGGVSVVSPPNPRIVRTRSGTLVYRARPYALVPSAYQIGCN
jgi:hypothetical protein